MRFGSTFWALDEPLVREGRIPLTCPICGIHTDAPVRGTFTTPDSEFLQLPSMGMWLDNYFVQCTRCQGGILVIQSVGTDFEGGQITSGAFVYPLRSSAFETDALASGAVPAAILTDLQQAELSFFAGAYYGAGLLLRRACQNICREQGIPGGDLKTQIREMADRGIITRTLADMADTVRIVGNELAHPDPQTPFVILPEEVAVGRNFVEQLVRTVYIDPARAKKLKEGLAKKGVK